MKRSTYKSALKNLSLFLVGCLLALGLLETALRIHNPLEIRFKPDRIVLPVNKRYVFDNRAKFPTKLPPTTVHTKNSLGFRGAPPPKNFADYLTLVTIGGSTTECFYLSDGKTWPDLLGRDLSQSFNKVWLNNAGLDGATTYRHIILLEDYVIRLHPKVVLFLMGINDVGHGDIEADELRNAPQSRVRRLFRTLMYHSEVYSLGQNLWHFLIAQKRGLHHTEIDLKAAGALEQIPAAVVRQTLDTHRKDYLPFYAKRLEKLATLCRESGIAAVFITQPTLYGPGRDPLTGVDLAGIKLGEDLNGQLMFEIVDLYNDVTRRVAAQEHILLIDLAREMPRDSSLYYDYLHYTEEGAVRVAEIIDRALQPYLSARFPAFKK